MDQSRKSLGKLLFETAFMTEDRLEKMARGEEKSIWVFGDNCVNMVDRNIPETSCNPRASGGQARVLKRANGIGYWDREFTDDKGIIYPKVAFGILSTDHESKDPVMMAAKSSIEGFRKYIHDYFFSEFLTKLQSGIDIIIPCYDEESAKKCRFKYIDPETGLETVFQATAGCSIGTNIAVERYFDELEGINDIDDPKKKSEIKQDIKKDLEIAALRIEIIREEFDKLQIELGRLSQELIEPADRKPIILTIDQEITRARYKSALTEAGEGGAAGAGGGGSAGAGGGSGTVTRTEDVYSMSNDDQIGIAFRNWTAGDPEITYIPPTTVLIIEQLKIAIDEFLQDESKTKLIIVTAENLHYCGIYAEKGNPQINYFDPIVIEDEDGLTAPMHKISPEICHILKSKFQDHDESQEYDIFETATEIQTFEQYSTKDGEIVTHIKNNYCAQFVWFIMVGMAIGNITVDEECRQIMALKENEKTFHEIDIGGDEKKSNSFGDKIKKYWQLMPSDTTSRDTTHQQIINELFAEAIFLTTTPPTSPKAVEAAAENFLTGNLQDEKEQFADIAALLSAGEGLDIEGDNALLDLLSSETRPHGVEDSPSAAGVTNTEGESVVAATKNDKPGGRGTKRERGWV